MQQASATQPAAATPARFIDNGDGTVTDSSLGLMWSKATNTAKCVTHAAAVRACADLDLAGHRDWRLPTRAELLSLVDDTRHSPAIDTDAFADTHNDWYWANTLLASSSDYAWIVYFGYGYSDDARRDGDSAFARAVRSVPSGQ